MTNNKGFLNLLIKPTDLCNLNCSYCFSSSCDQKQITIERVKKFIELACEEVDKIQIVWHGGEPTCMPIDFYKKIFEFIEQVGFKYDVEITQSIQSNCINVSSDYINLFLKYSVSWGTSFDGLYNDDQRGRTNEYLKTIERFHDNNINVGAICVITKKSIDRIIENYNYFNKISQSVNFRPIILDGAALNLQEKFAIIEYEYFEALKILFDYWIKDKNCKINVNPFLNYIRLLITGKGSICCHSSCLGNWFCLDSNGDITPCNRYFPKEFKYNNIDNITSFSELYQSAGFNKLLALAIERRSLCKKQCKYYTLCKGGCNHSALIGGAIDRNDNFDCKLFIDLMGFIQQRLNEKNKIENPVLIKLLRQLKYI